MFAGTERFAAPDFLGCGTMGSVYRALDQESGCTVALKTLVDLSPNQVYRLKQEFRSLAGVVHPNVVQLYDLVVNEGVCFFTMEFVDGVDFVSFVRGDDNVLDESGLDRFLLTAPQLLRGLAAIHAAGRLHRDLKPANTRVTPGGQVKVLDFDLAVSLAPTQRSLIPEGTAGTFAYMAPEQLWGMTISAAADLYSAGVVFYEALTGRLPFEDVSFSGRPRQPQRPRELQPNLPEWLEGLTLDLLQSDPERRPSVTEALRRLGAAETAHPRIQTPWVRTRNTAFVGRTVELERLRDLFRETPGGGPRVACVEGSSGMGKSELVRHFLSEVGQRATVLQGRCHPQELVAYPSLDGIIDGVTQFLLRADEETRAMLLRPPTDALVRLFPVLGRVPGLTRAPSTEVGDEAHARRQAIAALRELLTRLTTIAPLVLSIDDLQWGDNDSATLLREVLRPPGAPPLLLILSYRTEDRGGIPLLKVLNQLARDADLTPLHRVELGPLPPEDASHLARLLCADEPRSESAVSGLVKQAGGSPYLIAEMAWHLEVHGEKAANAGLVEILRARLDGLSPPARELAELVAVSGSPIDRHLLLDACAAGQRGRPLLFQLESECVVRAVMHGDQLLVQSYHDQIREAVLDRLSEATRARRHLDLANVFEASGQAEPEVLAQHFHGAGQLPKAADYAVAAAEKAAEAFAFDRAAELYRAAHEWAPRDVVWNRTLQTHEADALVNAARFVEAARVFLAAAQDAPPKEALELRRRAAEQYLASGKMEDGVDVLSGVLRELGLVYPRTTGSTVARLLYRLTGIALRGFDPRAARAGGEEGAMMRGDTCYSAARTLVDADPIRGIFFSLQSLRYALQTGDPVRQGLSLIFFGGSLVALGGNGFLQHLGERMMARAETLARQSGSPLLQGMLAVQYGQLAMLAARWRQAVELCDTGLLALSKCRGAAYESFIGRQMALRAVAEIGDLDELDRRAREAVEIAVTVGSRFGESAASQHLAYGLLARGDVKSARRFGEMRQDLVLPGSMHLQQQYAVHLSALCDLYEGKRKEGLAAIDAVWPALVKSQMTRIPLVRVDTRGLHGRLAVACAQLGDGDRSRMLRAAANDAHLLERERRVDGSVQGAVIRAGIARLGGQRQAAETLLEDAQRQAERADMQLVALAAQYWRGESIGGEDGYRLRQEAALAMDRRGISEPRRWAAAIVPGFDAA